jgi:hypothetical protein
MPMIRFEEYHLIVSLFCPFPDLMRLNHAQGGRALMCV